MGQHYISSIYIIYICPPPRCVSGAHQEGRRVDVDGLDDGELLLHLPHRGPRPVQLHLHPVADAAVLPLEGGDQRLLGQLEAEGELVSAGGEDERFPVI